MTQLAYTDTLGLLARLGTAGVQCVLIGGQAVNFWAERYLPRAPGLRAAAPFTSKDIDFCGTAEMAEACKRALAGDITITGPNDLTSCLGVVRYLDSQRRPQSLDFLRAPYGVDGEEVKRMAVPVGVPYREDVIEFRVMHPAHVLESRASNVNGLDGYRAERGLKQLRAAVECCLQFSRELLEAGRARDVLRINERVFRFAKSEHGLGVWLHDGVAVFDAVVRDPRLPPAFGATRYPQMVAELEAAQEAALARDKRARDASDARAAQEYVFESMRAGARSVFARLRADDGTVREVELREAEGEKAREGDRVRVAEDGCLQLVSRGIERGRGL